MVQIHETIESITNTRKSYSYHQDYDQQRQQQHQNNHHETGHNSPQYTTTKKTGLNTIGFVPTMGALHEGHLQLMRKARMENDVVFVSIFINPTQFGPKEDLSTYPRSIEHDVQLLQQENVDHVFIPTDPSIMYQTNHCTYIVAEGFDDTHEGKIRPGHFKGVATIVMKLFNIVRPTRAYFGQKDAIQCILIERIVYDMNLSQDISIVICETCRDKNDGLALSSRNVYLSADERKAASILYKSLCSAKDLYEHEKQQITTSGSKTMSSALVKDEVIKVLQTEPLVTEIQYVALNDIESLKEVDVVNLDVSTSTSSTATSRRKGTVLSIAVKIGSVRLIDNIILI